MRLAACLAAAVLACAPGAALAQHAPPHGTGTTVTLQPGSGDFMRNPHTRRFYELSKATLGPGAPKLDFAAYEQESFAIFRDLGAAMGMSPLGMVDHLKLIPGQVVQIVKEDPHVLDSYDKFIEAMIGPP